MWNLDVTEFQIFPWVLFLIRKFSILNHPVTTLISWWWVIFLFVVRMIFTSTTASSLALRVQRSPSLALWFLYWTWLVRRILVLFTFFHFSKRGIWHSKLRTALALRLVFNQVLILTVHKLTLDWLEVEKEIVCQFIFLMNISNCSLVVRRILKFYFLEAFPLHTLIFSILGAFLSLMLRLTVECLIRIINSSCLIKRLRTSNTLHEMIHYLIICKFITRNRNGVGIEN